MTDQSPRDIEREIEAEREALAQTIERLQSSVSPQALVAKVEDRLRTDGGALLRHASQRIAAQPLAAAVTAAGLAWLLFGPESPERRDTLRTRNPRRETKVGRSSTFDRDRRRAAQWLMSHDPDPQTSLRKARERVSPRVARMIDRLDGGTSDLPPRAKVRVRQARLRAISARIATERQSVR